MVVLGTIALVIVVRSIQPRDRSEDDVIDFGSHVLDGAGVEVTQVVELKNHTSRPRHVKAIRMSCGSTDAELSSRDLAPRGSVDLTITLRLSGPGRRDEQVTVTFDDDTLRRIRISGHAYRRTEFYASSRAVLLRAGREERVTLIATIPRNSPPASPTLALPRGVDAEFEGWSPVLPSGADEEQPGRWQGDLVLRGEAADTSTSVVIVELGDARVELDLSGWPWNSPTTARSGG